MQALKSNKEIGRHKDPARLISFAEIMAIYSFFKQM